MPVRVAIARLCAGELELEREAVHYLVSVHRLRPGDGFVAFDPESATEAEAVLIEAQARRAVCKVGAPRPSALVPSFAVTLVQALGKGDKPEQVVRSATALGVARISLALAERSVVRPREGAGKLERLRSVALDAARQCGRGDVPKLEGPRLVVETVDEWRQQPGRKLCLHPSAPSTLLEALAGWHPDQAVVLLVGPEGGWSEGELAAADAAGFVRVRLGHLALRTELAGIAALSAIVCLADGCAPNVPKPS